VKKLQPVSYLMGELLDSSDETSISAAAYNTRVKSYLAALGGQVDLWEIGNEVNGDWTGPVPDCLGQADRSVRRCVRGRLPQRAHALLQHRLWRRLR
jgi:hypothetical protein